MYKKHNTLIKLTYFALAYGGLMIEKDKKWFPIWTGAQIFLLCTAMTSGLTELFIGSREFHDIVGLLSSLITCGFAITRLLRVMARRKEIRSVLDRLDILRLKMVKDEKNKHFLSYAENFGRKMSTMIFILCNGFPIAACLFVIVTNFALDRKEKLLVHKIWMPWDHREAFLNVLSNISVTILALPVLSVYAGIHLWEVTFTLYISAYAKTFQNNLISKGIKNRKIYEQHKFMIQIIKDHNEVLSAIKYWEAQISPLMPCGFGYSSLKALKRNEISIAIDYYVRAVLTLFPAFVHCCCGQQIITQMEKLHRGTYMSKWYEESSRIRKTFLTMMIRTTNPPSINYRLFVTFDHVLLSMILQTVYSYLMVMVNLDSE
ncbi:hypothetical protein O3M35_002567 [Rhynocoris fuscipes]|uniref:Odorant receptor n=1 Tax=Rhynocoris fuscipes TaxID=488301 RepID=A0AAW1CLZ6_9HEMI